MTRRATSILSVCVLMQFALTGCKDDNDATTDTTCHPGTLECACYNDFCNAGLVCEADRCVVPTVDTESDSATESDSTTDTGVDTNPTTSEISFTNENGRICAQGVVVGPNSNSDWGDHWGAGIGLNLCQPNPESTNVKTALEECHNDLSELIGVNVTFSGTLPTALWVNFEDDIQTTDTVNGANSYIIVENAASTDYLFENAAVWYQSELDRPTLQPGRIVGVQFQVAAQLGQIEAFDFCIEEISLVPRVSETDSATDTESETDSSTDTNLESDTAAQNSDTETSVSTDPIPSTDDVDTDSSCAPDTFLLIANESNWVDQCTNILGAQGYWYKYSD